MSHYKLKRKSQCNVNIRLLLTTWLTLYLSSDALNGKFTTVYHCLSVLKDKFRLEPSDEGVQEGGRAVFDCAPPRGSPAPTVFWKKDGRIVDFERETR